MKEHSAVQLGRRRIRIAESWAGFNYQLFVALLNQMAAAPIDKLREIASSRDAAIGITSAERQMLRDVIAWREREEKKNG